MEFISYVLKSEADFKIDIPTIEMIQYESEWPILITGVYIKLALLETRDRSYPPNIKTDGFEAGWLSGREQRNNENTAGILGEFNPINSNTVGLVILANPENPNPHIPSISNSVIAESS